jgi:RND family efflux transporter MFP subunit
MPQDREDQLRSDLASLRIEREPTVRRAARPRRRWVLPLLIGLGLAAAGAVWAVRSRPLPVTVAYATKTAPGESGPVPVLSGSGYIVTGDRYISVGVRVAGRIDRYFVEEGQSVHKGDPLVQLDDRDYRAAVAATQARLASARANAALAESDLRRGEALHRSGVISQQEYDVMANKAAVARAAISELDAELQQAKINLDYATLRAPADGVVLAKLKEVGEIAMMGGFAGSGDLIRLANLADMRAEVDVNEADLNRIALGQPAQVTPDAYPDARYAAEVVKLYPQVDRQKGTLKTEVHILEPDAKLLPDMSARVTFLQRPDASATAEPAVLIPAAAVRRNAQGDSFVWLVSDNQVRQQRIETGGEAGDKVRVTTGMQGGEAVVVSGDAELTDGRRVAPTR